MSVYITQLLCKCDLSLSQEGTYRKSLIFECFFFFLQQTKGIFSALISRKSRKEICIACPKSVFVEKIFSWIEEVWFWKSPILWTAPQIYQLWDFWPIRAWYQNLVSWNGDIKGISSGSAALSPSSQPIAFLKIYWLLKKTQFKKAATG